MKRRLLRLSELWFPCSLVRQTIMSAIASERVEIYILSGGRDTRTEAYRAGPKRDQGPM